MSEARGVVMSLVNHMKLTRNNLNKTVLLESAPFPLEYEKETVRKFNWIYWNLTDDSSKNVEENEFMPQHDVDAVCM